MSLRSDPGTDAAPAHQRLRRYEMAPVIVSTRAAAGQAQDAVAPEIAQLAADCSFQCREPLITPDGDAVGHTLRQLLTENPPAVIITSGGTGLAPDDQTPEQATALIDTPIPGIMEAVRAHGRQYTPLAALSRGVAGVAGSTVIITLPGSPAAVRESSEVLRDLLPHLCDQVADLRRGHRWGSPLRTSAENQG